MANVGSCRTIIESGIGRVRDESRSVRADACVPCRTVIEVLREGVVAANLQSACKAATKVQDESVVVADAPRDPRGGVRSCGISLVGRRIVDSAVYIGGHGLVQVG